MQNELAKDFWFEGCSPFFGNMCIGSQTGPCNSCFLGFVIDIAMISRHGVQDHQSNFRGKSSHRDMLARHCCYSRSSRKGCT